MLVDIEYYRSISVKGMMTFLHLWSNPRITIDRILTVFIFFIEAYFAINEHRCWNKCVCKRSLSCKQWMSACIEICWCTAAYFTATRSDYPRAERKIIARVRRQMYYYWTNGNAVQWSLIKIHKFPAIVDPMYIWPGISAEEQIKLLVVPHHQNKLLLVDGFNLQSTEHSCHAIIL